MEISEEKIRQIAEETRRVLGSQADPVMIKKVVKEVVKRLILEAKEKENS